MNDNLRQTTPKEIRIKNGEKILSIIHQFSATEKVVFIFLILVAVISTFSMLNSINRKFLVPIPAHGGSLIEGVVGLPRSINPVLSFTDTDRDLSVLIYSGLMKHDKDTLVGDLAKSYSVSEDGLTYTFTLKDNIRFHDGEPLTTDDVEFTIQKIQDSALKSPRRADWANITIKKVSDKEIQFILKQPYSPFLSNTTIGILPKHIWKNVSAEQFIFSQYNIEPIGSGPYKLDSITRDDGGIPQSYSLSPFGRYYDSEAFISSLVIIFFPNEKDALDAYENGSIQSISGIYPSEAARLASTSSNTNILESTLPRIFGVFFNQNNAIVLSNKEVRQALDMALNRDKIIDEVLFGYGTPLDGPLPVNTIKSDFKKSYIGDPEGAKALLTKEGWKLNSDGILEKKEKTSTQLLQFSISTADTPDLKQVANIIKTQWESIGAKVDIKIFEYGDLSQNIIKTRKYDALLFGEFIGKDLDLYAFWHSSQRNSPGLNISMYVNSKVDTLLEEIRTISSAKSREAKYKVFSDIIQDDLPAIFIYSPQYIYIVPDKIKGMNFELITNPSDRLHDISKWYIKTDNVWKMFVE